MFTNVYAWKYLMLSLNEIQSDHSRYVVLKKHDLYRDVFVYLFNDAWLDTTSRQIHVQSSTLSTYYTRQPAPTRVRFTAVLSFHVYARPTLYTHKRHGKWWWRRRRRRRRRRTQLTGQTWSQLLAQIFIPGHIPRRYLQHALTPTTM